MNRAQTPNPNKSDGVAGAIVSAMLVLACAGQAQAPEPTEVEAPAAEVAGPAIIVQGSGHTMPSFTRPWAAIFRERSGIRVRIEGTGTSTGPPALLRGDAHVASMTRPLKAAEREAFRRVHGTEPIEIPVAADAVAVFVNERNPLEALTLQQVDAIFSITRACGAPNSIDDWSAAGLDEAWRGRAISLYGRRPGSGTGTYFADVAMCGGTFKDWLRINPGGESAARAVAESRFAIGFGGRNEARAGMKALALARAGGAAVPPQRAPVYNGSYPLARFLYLYVLPPEVRPWPEGLRDFLAFVLSAEAQAEVERAGFLHLPEAEAARALERLPPSPMER